MIINETIAGEVKEVSPRYKDKSDPDIIDEIKSGNDSGIALFYLLFGRYLSMLYALYQRTSSTIMDFDDFMLELDIKLYKNGCTAIRHFNYESSFATYLNTIARNILYDFSKESGPVIDTEIGISTEDNYDYRMAEMIDAINRYPNEDSKFVLFKTLEGYQSKEIAVLLSVRRRANGIMTEEKDLKASYIDTLRSRAMKDIRKHLVPEIPRAKYLPCEESVERAQNEFQHDISQKVEYDRVLLYTPLFITNLKKMLNEILIG
jgi:RNA polymerase sigma factor (sigma-70 family)